MPGDVNIPDGGADSATVTNVPTHTAPTIGPQQAHQILPGYEVLEEIGRGGMGIVYKAQQRTLDRVVAIKMVHPGASLDRFAREARLLAQINSPQVVAVYDFVPQVDGSGFLVMEWVDGTDLGRLIRMRQAPADEEEVLPWMRQTCQGMLAAEEQGIIHRDVKPSNILIDGRNRARVADFGLARGTAVFGDASTSNLAMGTPFYMAPEQAEDAHRVDTRADIYSFGATFYHVLTGVPPFQGESPFSILFKAKTEPLMSPRQRNPLLTERTTAILERCLSKAPADRFSSFAELVAQLEACATESSPWAISRDPLLETHVQRYYQRRPTYLDAASKESIEDVYEFGNKRRLVILRGDLLQQSVNVLVNSCESFLSMDQGLSGVFQRFAGSEVEQELRRFAPARPGRVIVTGPGRLPVRFIFHAVTTGYLPTEVSTERYQDWQYPTRDLITELVSQCLMHADTLFVRSMALPLLGTGFAQQTSELPLDPLAPWKTPPSVPANGEFTHEACLDAMFQCLARTLSRGLTAVREVRIVLFD